MSEKNWPTETDLLRFVDQDLSPEQLERIEDHVRECSACAKEVNALRTLMEDVAAPVAAPPLDVGAHVASVMSRLDAPLPVAQPLRRKLFGGALALAAAATLALALGREKPDAALTARGARSASSLERDVGVELYAQERTLLPLPSGSRVGSRTALTAGLRNASGAPVYLLLFAVDAENAVHWITPAYTVAGTDPISTSIAPTSVERPLPTAAVFDDLAPGTLRVVAIVTREPSRVSEIETLAPAELALERLERRFARGDVRQFVLSVAR
ncbi:MAG TPA: zf-HC2 domain-containing protein [Polyangiaceae bacterium]